MTKREIQLSASIEDRDELNLDTAPRPEKTEYVLFGFDSLEEAQAKTFCQEEGGWLFCQEEGEDFEKIEWIDNINNVELKDNEWLMAPDSLNFGPIEDEDE